jgi:hypothetical protein
MIYSKEKYLTLYIPMIYVSTMKRESQLLIRVELEEKKAFEESAEIAGTTLSAWIRQHLRLAAIQELSKVGRRATFLKPVPLAEDGNKNTV